MILLKHKKDLNLPYNIFLFFPEPNENEGKPSFGSF